MSKREILQKIDFRNLCDFKDLTKKDLKFHIGTIIKKYELYGAYNGILGFRKSNLLLDNLRTFIMNSCRTCTDKINIFTLLEIIDCIIKQAGLLSRNAVEYIVSFDFVGIIMDIYDQINILEDVRTFELDDVYNELHLRNALKMVAFTLQNLGRLRKLEYESAKFTTAVSSFIDTAIGSMNDLQKDYAKLPRTLAETLRDQCIDIEKFDPFESEYDIESYIIMNGPSIIDIEIYENTDEVVVVTEEKEIMRTSVPCVIKRFKNFHKQEFKFTSREKFKIRITGFLDENFITAV